MTQGRPFSGKGKRKTDGFPLEEQGPSVFVLPVIFTQLPFAQQGGIPPLAQHFVHPDGNRIRQVQAAGVGNHRDAHTGLGMLVQEGFWETGSFLSEKQVAGVGIGTLGMDMGSFCGKECDAGWDSFWVFGKKVRQAVVVGDVEQVPVIQTSTF